MSAKRLTSRNLFDDVFALLSTNVELDYGPTTVRDELALLSEVNNDHMSNEFNEEQNEQNDILNDEINAKENDKGDYFNSYRKSNYENDKDEESWSTMRIPTVTSITHQTPKQQSNNLYKEKRHHLSDIEHQLKELEEEEKGTPHQFVLPTLSVEMNAEDSAVQEATKYATYFDEAERKTESKENSNNNNNTMNSSLMQPLEHNQENQEYNRNLKSENGSSEVNRRRITTINNRSRPHLTAQEQLQVMPLDELHRGVYYRGVCAMYRAGKGFGFIAPDLGGPDVYFIKDAVHFIFTRCVLKCYLHFNLLQVGTMSNNNNSNHANNVMESSNDIVMTSVDDDLPIDESYLHHVLIMSRKQDVQQEQQYEETGDNDSSSKNVENNTLHNENENELTLVNKSTETEEVNTINKNEEKAQIAEQEFTKPVPYYLQLAAKAALQLTESQSLLLSATLKYGQVSVRVRDYVEFNVVRNKASRQNSRLLRAENIRGSHSDSQNNSFALPIEQAWFYNLFAQEKSNTVNSVNEKDSVIGYIEELDMVHNQEKANKLLLVRYEGTVKYYDDAEDRQRGYIKINTASLSISLSSSSTNFLQNEQYLKSNRQYENNNQEQMANVNVHDVAFTSDAFLWSSKESINNVHNDINNSGGSKNNTSMKGGEFTIQVGMRVRFSVFGREKLHRVGGYRYSAILVTGLDDQPLNSDNIILDESMIRKRTSNKESSTKNNNNEYNYTDNIDEFNPNANLTQQDANATSNTNANTNGMFVEDEDDDDDDYFNDENNSSSDVGDMNDVQSYYSLHSSTLNTSNNNNVERQANEVNAKQGTIQRKGQKSSDERLLYKNNNNSSSSQRKRQRDQDETLLLFDEDDYAMI